MEPTNLTIEILKQIRDELRGTNSRIDETNARLDQTNAELHDFRVETTSRFDTHGKAIAKLISEVHSLGDRFDNFLTGAHQQEHADLRGRVTRLEEKVG